MDLIGSEKMRQLVRRLHRATEEGRATWEETGDSAFSFSTSSVTVTVRSVDRDNLHPYQVTVVDEQGRVVDEWTTSRDGSLVENVEAGALYHAARRQVFNVDAVLDALLTDLPGDPGPEAYPPPPPRDDEVPF